MSDKMISMSALTFMRLVLYYSGGYQFNFEGMFTEPRPIGKKLKKTTFRAEMDHPIDIWRVQQFLHVHEATFGYICKRYICTCSTTYMHTL